MHPLRGEELRQRLVWGEPVQVLTYGGCFDIGVLRETFVEIAEKLDAERKVMLEELDKMLQRAMTRERSMNEELARAEAQIRRLEQETAELRAMVTELRQQLGGDRVAPATSRCGRCSPAGLPSTEPTTPGPTPWRCG